MRRRRVLSLASLLITLGAGCSTAHDPIIDRSGVDDARYNRDLASCRQGAFPVGFSNPVASCMTAKGYTVLLGK